MKSLFCPLVRPILECGFVLWNSSSSGSSMMVERFQRKFLHLVTIRFNIFRPLRDLCLSSIAGHKHMCNLVFLSNIISGKIDSHLPYYLKFILKFLSAIPGQLLRLSSSRCLLQTTLIFPALCALSTRTLHSFFRLCVYFELAFWARPVFR